MSHLPLLAFLPGAVVWTHWCRLLEEASLTRGKWHLELRVALDSALPAEERVWQRERQPAFSYWQELAHRACYELVADFCT